MDIAGPILSTEIALTRQAIALEGIRSQSEAEQGVADIISETVTASSRGGIVDVTA